MKQIGQKYHKGLTALIIILALSAVVILFHLSGALDKVEFKLYDFRINTLRNTRPRSNDIYMILLDDESIEWAQRERGWGWPWPREAYGEFLDYMRLGHANSVVFDVIFSEPSVYRNNRQDEIINNATRNLQTAQLGVAAGDPERALPLLRDLAGSLQDLNARQDDAAFVQAGRDYGRVVHGVLFSTKSGSADTWPSNLNKPMFNPVNFDSIISQFAISDGEIMNGAQFPIEEIRNGAAALGSLTGIHDKDNIIRRHRLFTLFDGKAVPGLASASLLVSGQDGNISFDPRKKVINWGAFTIPVDNEGMTLLRYRGNPIDVYHNKSMSAVLQSAADYTAGKEPLLPPDVFDGCYVFVGYYAQGLFDTFPTPVASVYPGVGVHITMLDNMLMGDFITKAPVWMAILIIVASVILVVILASFAKHISAAVAGLVGSFIVLVAAGFLAFYLGWWIPLVAPIGAMSIAFLIVTLYNYATEGKDKRFIKGAFSRILSPKVIDQIIADPSQLKLGGEKRKMTALFTDIQSFSSISSELQDEYGENGPKALVNLLNLYLTEMSNVVLDNGGTIDKYEGDAIIGFFGAPVWIENHAVQACRSAIMMKRREKEIVDRIMSPGGEFHIALTKLIGLNVLRKERPLYTRIGLNTGDMVVGFMGTPAKMDYTIMGNAVNLAARLEGVNKQYYTHGILISEYTRDQIGDGFLLRPLSRITVVGIPVPVRIFELLEIISDASPEMTEMVRLWEEAFKAYEGKDFEGAKKLFNEVYRKDPEDKVAKLYINRCEEFIASPPPADWDGVDNLTEK
jgi:class 3 adenylate cyclase/CHASE2 domain-containing sensor protein